MRVEVVELLLNIKYIIIIIIIIIIKYQIYNSCLHGNECQSSFKLT